MTHESIPAGTRLGHILLNVADLDRAVSFYRDVLGFDVVAQFESSAFVAAGPYYHHIALATWKSKGGSPPPPDRRGSITSPSTRATTSSCRIAPTPCRSSSRNRRSSSRTS